VSLQLLFDENFGRPLVEALGSLLAFHELRPRVHHLLELQHSGVADAEWIASLAPEDWLVVTSDKGARGASKLPRICSAKGITHILLKGRLVYHRQFDKARAVLVVWPDIIRASCASAGSRFRLFLRGERPVLEAVP
jgi:hypothetical protein